MRAETPTGLEGSRLDGDDGDGGAREREKKGATGPNDSITTIVPHLIVVGVGNIA